MIPAMEPARVTARLREQSASSDLRSDRRLATKVEMSAEAITRRLQRVSALRDACLRWAKIGKANGLGPRKAAAPR